MKILAILWAAAVVTQGFVVPDSPVLGSLAKSAALVEKSLLQDPHGAEQRIVGGTLATLGQYPYQAGLLVELIGIANPAVCGAAIVRANRLITAASCWYDGVNQARQFTVVVGSLNVFAGGVRVITNNVHTHTAWSPTLARNDIAMIYLVANLGLTVNIAVVPLPAGAELNDNFSGAVAVASGYGAIDDSGNIPGVLRGVNLSVISNNVCTLSFPLQIQASNVCTGGSGGVGPCRGDSGSPLVVTRNNNRILIGINSFVSGLGCTAGYPAAYTRVSTFMTFINQHL